MPVLPNLVKHCTIAIYEGGSVRAGSASRFRQSFEIARVQLFRTGYLTYASQKGDIRNIRLTAKGQARERLHRREGRHKNAKFDVLYAKFVEAPKQAEVPTQKQEIRKATVKQAATVASHAQATAAAASIPAKPKAPTAPKPVPKPAAKKKKDPLYE